MDLSFLDPFLGPLSLAMRLVIVSGIIAAGQTFALYVLFFMVVALLALIFPSVDRWGRRSYRKEMTFPIQRVGQPESTSIFKRPWWLLFMAIWLGWLVWLSILVESWRTVG